MIEDIFEVFPPWPALVAAASCLARTLAMADLALIRPRRYPNGWEAADRAKDRIPFVPLAPIPRLRCAWFET